MSSPQPSFPPVPEDTFLAATALYGKGNIYLRLGDALEQLLNGLLPTSPKTQSQGKRFLETHVHPALLTIFQYVEELTNEQILEAVRSRLELKYALHLPLNSPGTSLNTLCEFHQSFFADPEQQQFLQSLLDRVVDFGLVKPSHGEQLEARRILATICTLSQFDEVTKAMHQALEALAVTDPEWLRRVTRPYWYDRYNRSNRLAATSFSDPRWSARALEVVGDMQYLLQAVDQRRSPQLASLPEIQHIRQIFAEKLLLCIDETDQTLINERMVKECNLCNLV